MATVFLIISLLLSWYFFVQKRGFKRARQSETGGAKLLGYLLEWSASLAIVLLFYHTLLLVLALGWRWITLAGLMNLEQRLTAAQKFTARYKPEWGTWIGVLILLYLLSDFWIRFLGRDTPFRVFKKTKRVVHFVSTLAFLFASFTLLGFHPGPAAATLEIHLQKVRADYGNLQQELGTALVGATINQTYNKVLNALPNSGAIPDLLNDSLNEESRLRNAYADAASKYSIHDHKIDNLLRQTGEFRKRVEHGARIEPHALPIEPVIVPDFPPETVTYEKISKARERVSEYRARFRPTLLRLLNKPGGKEIVLELPKGAIDHLTELFTPAAENFPLLKPVLDVLKSTVNDAVKQELKTKLDNLTDSIIERPNRLENSLPDAAREITNLTPVKITPEQTRQFRHEVRVMQQQVTAIQDASERLNQNIRVAESRNQQLASRRAVADATVPPRISRTRSAGREHSRAPEYPTRPIDPIDSRFPNESGAPRESGIPSEPLSPGSQPNFPSGGGSGGSTSYVQCICNHYINGALVSSVPIPEGASCGGRICGGRRKQ